jgi:Rrf2 family transcriptional regulator, iron-sulfur cluster assembly transcription factor
MVSQTGEYALRAVLHIAQQDGPTTAEAVADAVGAPRNYLHKVLHVLVRHGVLRSLRGRTGGFSVALPLEQLTLHAVVAPFDAIPSRRRCILGRAECSESDPCTAHWHWQSVAESITTFFRSTTVADLLAGRRPSVGEGAMVVLRGGGG